MVSCRDCLPLVCVIDSWRRWHYTGKISLLPRLMSPQRIRLGRLMWRTDVVCLVVTTITTETLLNACFFSCCFLTQLLHIIYIRGINLQGYFSINYFNAFSSLSTYGFMMGIRHFAISITCEGNWAMKNGPQYSCTRNGHEPRHYL